MFTISTSNIKINLKSFRLELLLILQYRNISVLYMHANSKRDCILNTHWRIRNSLFEVGEIGGREGTKSSSSNISESAATSTLGGSG